MIYLLSPTIRPDIFISNHKNWISKAENPSNIVTKVVVNSFEDSVKVASYTHGDVVISQTDRKGVVQPLYKLTRDLECENDSDIIVVLSDDFDCPDKWDTYLINKFADFKGCLFVRDGYQVPGKTSGDSHGVISIPIMTWYCLKKLNKAIYHPIYTHMFSDEELWLNVNDLGLLWDDRVNDETIFQHKHWVVGMRELDSHDKEFGALWGQDQSSFNRRKFLPVEERIRV